MSDVTVRISDNDPYDGTHSKIGLQGAAAVEAADG